MVRVRWVEPAIGKSVTDYPGIFVEVEGCGVVVLDEDFLGGEGSETDDVIFVLEVARGQEGVAMFYDGGDGVVGTC